MLPNNKLMRKPKIDVREGVAFGAQMATNLLDYDYISIIITQLSYIVWSSPIPNWMLYYPRESPSPRCVLLVVTTNQSSICALATNYVSVPIVNFKYRIGGTVTSNE